MHLESALLERQRGRAVDPGTEGQSDAEPEVDDTGHRVFRCARCGQRIARVGAQFAMTGQDGARVYVNPHGRVFEVVTVRVAEGLVGLGGATSEHTWFGGYAWQVACCTQCSIHLGWQFTAAGADRSPPRFVALIRTALVEDEEPAAS